MESKSARAQQFRDQKSFGSQKSSRNFAIDTDSDDDEVEVARTAGEKVPSNQTIGRKTGASSSFPSSRSINNSKGKGSMVIDDDNFDMDIEELTLKPDNRHIKAMSDDDHDISSEESEEIQDMTGVKRSAVPEISIDGITMLRRTTTSPMSRATKVVQVQHDRSNVGRLSNDSDDLSVEELPSVGDREFVRSSTAGVRGSIQSSNDSFFSSDGMLPTEGRLSSESKSSPAAKASAKSTTTSSSTNWAKMNQKPSAVARTAVDSDESQTDSNGSDNSDGEEVVMEDLEEVFEKCLIEGAPRTGKDAGSIHPQSTADIACVTAQYFFSQLCGPDVVFIFVAPLLPIPRCPSARLHTVLAHSPTCLCSPLPLRSLGRYLRWSFAAPALSEKVLALQKPGAVHTWPHHSSLREIFTWRLVPCPFRAQEPHMD